MTKRDLQAAAYAAENAYVSDLQPLTLTCSEFESLLRAKNCLELQAAIPDLLGFLEAEYEKMQQVLAGARRRPRSRRYNIRRRTDSRSDERIKDAAVIGNLLRRSISGDGAS